MLTRRRLRLHWVLKRSLIQILFLMLWATFALVVYEYWGQTWVAVPWLPMSLVGTALAFYVGFKNNSSYGRLWEARKIWGAIVNTSRSWGTICKHFLTPTEPKSKKEKKKLQDTTQRLIYRHIAWLYILREQLLTPRSWEHYQTNPKHQYIIDKTRKTLRKNFDTETLEELIEPLLSKDEREQYQGVSNRATQILDKQSEELASCKEAGWVSDFQHIEMQKLITDLYTQQGKCERIKNFPFPRLYASASYWFVLVFIFFLPFSMIRSFLNMGPDAIWIVIPFTAVVGWVFLTMESIGDYSEHPFQGLFNDIPMKSLSRTIEIDLREMLGETELPPKIGSIDGVQM